MNTVEKVCIEVRSLPEFELQQVLDFVSFLKTRHGATSTRPANDVAGMGGEESNWTGLGKLAPELVTEPSKLPDLALMKEVRSKVRTGVTWTRDELYDRGIR